MIGGFLRYSLKTGKKIAVVFLGKDGPRYFSRNDFGGNETDIGLVAGRISEYFKSHYDTKEFKEGDIS